MSNENHKKEIEGDFMTARLILAQAGMRPDVSEREASPCTCSSTELAVRCSEPCNRHITRPYFAE